MRSLRHTIKEKMMAVDVQEELDEDVQMDFEVGDQPEPQTPKVDPIAEKLAKLEAENVELKQSMASYGGQQNLVESLTQALRGSQQPQAQLPQAQQKSFDDELGAIKDELLDNPDKALKRYGELLIKHEIAPVVGMLNQELMALRNELDQSKGASDPVFKDVVENYKAEVEAKRDELVKTGVRDAWKQAANQVAMAHMTEIIQRQVANQAKANDDSTDSLRGLDLPAGQRSAERKVVRLSQAEDSERQMLGLSFEDYAMFKGKK
jgi:hypothetical protein